MNPTVATPARILLIDANVYFARRITDALKQEGFEVSTQHADWLRAYHAGI